MFFFVALTLYLCVHLGRAVFIQTANRWKISNDCEQDTTIEIDSHSVAKRSLTRICDKAMRLRFLSQFSVTVGSLELGDDLCAVDESCKKSIK